MHPLDALAEGVVQHDFLHRTKATRLSPEPVSRLNVSHQINEKPISRTQEFSIRRP
jgi:hypothetical protein